jgi:hypothetical protein
VPVLLQSQELLLAAAAAAAAAGQEQLLQVTHQAVRADNHLHGMCSTTDIKIRKQGYGKIGQLHQAHCVEDLGCCNTMCKAALYPNRQLRTSQSRRYYSQYVDMILKAAATPGGRQPTFSLCQHKESACSPLA